MMYQSDNFDHYSEICGKKAYDKKGAITARNIRYKQDHILLRIYPCKEHWHLTKLLSGKFKPKRKERRKGYTFNRE